ncbi:hypothetical protein D3C78_1316930 [compost metagenome]
MTKAQLGQLGPQARLEHRPGAKQAQARLDLEQQRTRVMHADLGAETVGPGCQELLPIFDLRRVVFGGGKAFTQGLGGGHGLAGTQAQGSCRRIHRLQHPTLGRTGQQCQGLVGIGALTQRGVQRQLREENTDPAHRNLNARFVGRAWQRQSAPNEPTRRGT